MRHHPPSQLRAGDALLLRWAELDDAEALAEAVRESLEHLGPWMPWATPEAADVDEQRRRRLEMLAQTAAGTDYMYLVLSAPRGDLLGVCGLHRRVGPGALELGYWLRPGEVGRGYVTQAAAALTAAALDVPDVERVEIHCDEANLKSQAVARRLRYRLDRIEIDGKQAPAEVGRSMIWVFPA